MLASTTGMVVSVNGIASDVGAAILKKGGNAVDAAVATAFALAVVHPAAGNIGGGGFMIVRPAHGDPIAIDYRETAPAASTKTMYLDANGNINIRLTSTGYLAPGVPGTVRGLALAHKRYGALPWKDDVMPAVLLAERGFVLSPALSRSLNGELGRGMAPYPASVKAYGKAQGQWAAGDTIVLKDLGRTLRAIAEQGPDVFYTGWIADSVAASMKAGGGIMTKQDLVGYRAKARTPIRTAYQGFEVIGMPPPSSGGVTVAEMLNILENFDLKSYGRSNIETSHLMIEAMRRAYLDRARFLGDPDFVAMPIERLTSKSYAKTLAKGIDLKKASSSAELGKDILTVTQPREPDETNHFSIVDKDGMAVSNTFTLEGGFGSHVVASGTGFILNNEMGDFNKKPGTTDATGTIGTPANVIAPGKRMLSSMDPTIVTKNGQLFLVTGSPGSRTIINTVLDVVVNATTFGMNAREAVDYPRLDSEWMPDLATFERAAMADTTLIKGLEAMGHTIRGGSTQGDAHTIMFDPATHTAYGAADARSPDSKASKP
ncbi:MAG TPA: gamma-glutamyltransferase [Gemmatimonadaceae bacterium]|nr:gamma-glutamyltransferase [Gemmatimonadaceae bacterium]